MSYFRDMPVTKLLDLKDSSYSLLTEEFYFESNTLKKLSLPWQLTIPIGFIMDWESMGWFRGKNHVAGLIHDFLSRSDSVVDKTGKLLITKAIAAAVYMEFLIYRKAPLWRRWVKFTVVRWLPDCVYFAKKSITWVPLK